MTASSRFVRVTAVVAVAAWGLAACGGDDDDAAGASASPSGDTAVSVEATDAAEGTAATSDEVEAAETDGADDAPGSGEAPAGEVVPGEELAERITAAVVAAGSARSSLTSTVDASTIESEGVIDFTQPYRLDITTTVGAEGGELMSRVVALSESEIYVEVPDADQWFRIDASDESGLLGELGTEYYSPDETWRVWGAAGDFEVVGRETVDGVDATHYRLTAGEAGADLAEGLSTVDVWVGADDLPVRAEVGVTDPVSTVSISYSDWGVPVDVQAPPADQVLEF